VEPALLFIEKVRDLRQLVTDLTEYNMLKAAAIARHLLLDGESLADVAARIMRLRLQSPVGCAGMVEHYGAITDTKPTIFTLAHSVDPIRPRRPLVYLSQDRFLALKVAILHGEDYSVKDVISYTADTAGGIHRSRKEWSAAMRAGARFIIGGLPQFEQLMDGISHAILWGLRGVEVKLHNLIGLRALDQAQNAVAASHSRASMELIADQRADYPGIWTALEQNLARCGA
jgi:hypothetical protein